MITGVLFLDPKKEITIDRMIKKYLFRIILALFVFGVPFAFLEIFFNENYQFNINQIILSILNLIQGKSWGYLWYLYMLIGLYLIIPMIRVFVINAPRNTVKYILIILFVFTSLVPFVETLFQIKFAFYLPINSIFLFYLILGYYLDYYKISLKNKTIAFIIIVYILYDIIIALFYHSVFIYIDYMDLVNYYSPVVVMVSVAIFSFVRQKGTSNKICDFLSPLTFGIYMIHMLFINFIYKFLEIIPEKFPVILVVFLTFFLTTALSILFSYFARKINIIRKYLL
jgi:surface polysaccharide O-acyltransferase-like enzyme